MGCLRTALTYPITAEPAHKNRRLSLRYGASPAPICLPSQPLLQMVKTSAVARHFLRPIFFVTTHRFVVLLETQVWWLVMILARPRTPSARYPNRQHGR